MERSEMKVLESKCLRTCVQESKGFSPIFWTELEKNGKPTLVL